jgi:hypothetical protein
MGKISFIGRPIFVGKLVEHLNEYNDTHVYHIIKGDGSFWQRINMLFHLVSSDIVFSMAGAIYRNRFISMALALRKKVAMYWIGTDVLEARESYQKGWVNSRFINQVQHLCETDWIQQELKEIGVNARIVPMFALDQVPEPVPFPPQFSILAYVGKDRETFYGMPKLIRLANDFPKVEIKIFHISEYSLALPPNIKLLGWIDDLAGEFNDCVLFLRLPEHDGLGFTVLEALSHGRYVGYSYPFDHTMHINSYDILQCKVHDLYERFNSGSLDLNLAGVEFIRENHNYPEVMRGLLEVLNQV